MNKKITTIALAGLMALTSGLSAAAAIEKSGGALQNGAFLSLSDFPSAQGCVSYKGTADVDITKGDVVTISTGTTYYGSITKTTTAGDALAIGVALSTASYGAEVEVCLFGVARVNSAVSVVAGTKYVPSGTAGKVTAASAVAIGLYTPLSGTAQVVTSIETRTFGAGDSGGYFLGFVGK